MRPDALGSNRFATLVPTILALLAAVLVAGCGGGNAKTSSTDTGGGGTPTTTAKSIQLKVSSSTLPTTVVAPVELTAIVLDTNNNGLTGKTVTFSVTDNVAGSAYIDTVLPSTYISDLNGQVTAKLNLGTNATARNLTVTVTVDTTITATQTIAVAASSTPTSAAASSIQVVPSSATLLTSGGAPVSLTATVLDINNNVIAGKVVSFAVVDGVVNPVFITNIAAGGVTDSNGQATAQLNLGANTTARNVTVRVTVDTIVIGTTVVAVAASAAAPAALIELLASSGSLPASGAAPVTLTAVVLNAQSIGISGKIVSFSVTDPGNGRAFINNVSAGGVSDGGGLVTAQLNIGSNVAPRNLTVTVTVDSVVTASATIAVTNVLPPTAQTVQLLASSPSMPSSGISTVDLTAVVLDANNNAMGGKGVTFRVVDPSGTAFLNNFSGNSVTDVNGLVTAKLNVGADKSNRSIAVSITVDTVVTASVTVATTGTSITISGLNSVVFGASLALTAQLKDSSAQPIVGKPLTITSAAHNTISASPINTGVGGSVSFNVTGTVSGADTISVSGMGATQFLQINVNGSNFNFSSPPVNQNVIINTPQTLTVHWDIAGVNQVNQPILFSATRGTLGASTVNTDASGNASVSIQSPASGLATITASGPGGSPAASLNIIYITTSASNITLQATSATVPVNPPPPAAPTNLTALTAVVRDVNNNLVKGARVNFQIVADPSGGQLSGPSAITDINGVATVNYIAGTTSSPQNGVRVDATVVDVNGVAAPAGIAASVFLTTGGQSLFIRMETDNQIDVGTIGVFTKRYYALVTDSGGNPVPNTSVVFKVSPAQIIRDYSATLCGAEFCPGAFQKGRYWQCLLTGNLSGNCPGIGFFKLPGYAPVYNCLNEDINFNGILDPLEDTDKNGNLTPGNVAGVNGTDVTNASGIAVASVTYVRGFATWASVTLTATITVAGTEYKQTIDFDLPGLSSDYSNVLVPPPGVLSPFGEHSCLLPD